MSTFLIAIAIVNAVLSGLNFQARNYHASAFNFLAFTLCMVAYGVTK